MTEIKEVVDKKAEEAKKPVVKKKAPAKKRPVKKPTDKKAKKKPVIVEVADKEYTVRFPISALIKLKNEANIDIADLEDEETAQDLETIIALIWAGLVTESPEITREYLADSIEMYELASISEKVVSVISSGGK